MFSSIETEAYNHVELYVLVLLVHLQPLMSGRVLISRQVMFGNTTNKDVVKGRL